MKWYIGTLIGVAGCIGLWVMLTQPGQTLRRDTPPPAPVSEPEKPALHVKDLHLVEQNTTQKGWEIFAQEAALYDAEQLAIVSHIQARFFRSVTEALSVVAEQGRIDKATGNITIQGHVRLQHPEGYTMETEILHWHAARRVLYTDAKVEIQAGSVRIAGTGWSSDIDQQRFVLQQQVRASFQ